MDYDVIWTQTGSELLERAVRFIAIDRPQTADVFRSRAIGAVERLKQLPHLGPVLEAVPSRTVREVFCDPYRIFYRVFDSRRAVHIISLWHSSREEPTRADLLG